MSLTSLAKIGPYVMPRLARQASPAAFTGQVDWSSCPTLGSVKLMYLAHHESNLSAGELI